MSSDAVAPMSSADLLQHFNFKSAALHLILAPMSVSFEALRKEAGSMQLTKLDQICTQNWLQLQLHLYIYNNKALYYPVSEAQG